jgi:fibronectin-binding autotransporter adhesin
MLFASVSSLFLPVLSPQTHRRFKLAVVLPRRFYTGGTTITAGTLQLGDGGATGLIPGNVVDNGTLAFDHSNTYTFGGLISGSGSLVHMGSGTTILTADNTYLGGTTISA